MSVEEIKLSLPALPEYARLARLAVASLATNVGFTYDEVEDLRIAVGEACTLLIGPDGREGWVSLVYELTDDAIGVRVTGSFSTDDSADPDAVEFSERILSAVVDQYDFSPDQNALRLEKQVAGI